MVPAAAVLVVWVCLMPASGGFAPQDWYPAGLVLLGLVTVAAVGARRILPDSPVARLALLAMAAFVVWSFLSLAWSDAPGAAWDAANLILTALLAAWVFALTPWTPSTAQLLLLSFSAGAAIVCAATLVDALNASDLTSRFTDGRFNEPLEYPNTAAAFCFMSAIPALVVAARPDGNVVLKAACQTVATFLVTFGLLPQSRGSIIGTTVTIALLFVILPFRWRLAFHAAALAGAMYLAHGPIFDVYDAANAGARVSPALHDAARAIGLATAIGLVTGLLLALLEARVRVPGQRVQRRAGIAAWALVALLVAGAAIANADRLHDTAQRQWRSLKHPGVAYSAAESESRNRLAQADPLERYDYWRTSIAMFRDHPLTGSGIGGFEHAYTADRRYRKVSKYPHNLVLRVIAETGLIGFGLFVTLIVALTAGLVRGLRRAPLGERAVVGAGLGVTVYFFAHSTFDWLEAYPVLAGPALALPFAALGARSAAQDAPVREPRWGIPPRAAAATGVVAVLAAAYSLAAPWLALRYNERGVARWRADAAGAYADLQKAADIDPISIQASVAEGPIAMNRGELDRAKSAFEETLRREDFWAAHYELAVIAAARGDRAGALRQLQTARSLNPLEPLITDVEQVIRDNERIDPAELSRRLSESPLSKIKHLS